ncbi:GH92 family glycosyl hydrolase [Acidicapsa ligni]|uniref:GH92 family glycosyl hydrolase n=1 Tax=Acidicapsa ligni TaxID=542300 RepID=UPI0021DF7637|nr:GH92 family glycosyl hydrolase [Acidicapsa ligni]
MPLVAFSTTPYRLVDPSVGTANDGQTIPVVGFPFGMTGWTPETRPIEAHCISPYYYKDSRITGFRGSHWISGSCTQDYGSVTLMPTVGDVRVTPELRSSSYRHESEVESPAYYSAILDDYKTRVEMTGTTRSGMLRISFPKGAKANLLVEPNVKPGEGYIQIRRDSNEIVGYNPVHRLYQGNGKSAGFSGYFVARLQRPFAEYGVWCDSEVSKMQSEQKVGCKRFGAYITFPDWKGGALLVKVGTSFTSLEEARKNLDAENQGWDFERVQRSAEKEWRTLLDRIQVKGGSTDQQRIFYTALYHASLAPHIVSDADGTYAGFGQEGKLHNAGSGVYYDDYSLWDTFRALHPLLTILDPRREEQMVQSLIDKGEQGGYLPIFPAWNNYTQEMIGDHAVSLIVDAYAKGLRGFDIDNAYRLILQSAQITPPLEAYKDGRGRRGLQSYLRYGFIPLEDKVSDAYHHQEQVSRTLEYAYDDSLAADFAESMGHDAEAKQLRVRGENWRNVFDSTIGFVRGRHEDGRWSEPFQPDHQYNYITEGVPWQYTFFVPQNIPGLIKAVGGSEAFNAKLDGLFGAKLYNQGNEPSHHIAYLYDYSGAPWKTQNHVREILENQYHLGPSGLPGNDDAGQMSAWYVLSAMGFYPVCPGKPVYALSSPIFDRVVIHQSDGKAFTIRAKHASTSNRYIQTTRLNGRLYSKFEISHADILGGATLTFKLGPKPQAGTQ